MVNCVRDTDALQVSGKPLEEMVLTSCAKRWSNIKVDDQGLCSNVIKPDCGCEPKMQF